MTRYLGIYPGLSGASAIVEFYNGVAMLIDVIDCSASARVPKREWM